MLLFALVTLHIVTTEGQLSARPPASEPSPPPPPPEDLAPLSRSQMLQLIHSVTAPPPSPPYGSTPAGKREEGRGWLLQQKLRDFLRERLTIIRGGGDVLAIRAALSEIALMALESTLATGGRSSWESGVHPVAFRKACVAGASRSAHGTGSIVEALAALLLGKESTDADTLALALQCVEAIACDDPTTDVDNDHALAICATGVVRPWRNALGPSRTQRFPGVHRDHEPRSILSRRCRASSHSSRRHSRLCTRAQPRPRLRLARTSTARAWSSEHRRSNRCYVS